MAVGPLIEVFAGEAFTGEAFAGLAFHAAAAVGPRPVVVTRQILVQVSDLTVVTRRVMVAIESAVKPASIPPGDPGGCCPVEPTQAAFERVTVDYRATGGTRVTWSFVDTFYDEAPYAFQLQASPTGVSDGDDWVDAGPPAVDPAYLVDDRQRTYGVEQPLHYRLVLVTSSGTYVSKPVQPATVLSRQDWLLIREMSRKERLRQSLKAGTPGVLLKARRYGIRCSCVNPTTRERGNSACLVCYGTGVLGGYHPPLACTLAEIPPHNSRAETAYQAARGAVQDVILKARVTPGMPIVQEDVWVGTGDDSRYYIHRVWKEAVHRGVPVVYAGEFRRAPRSDVVYRFPITASSTLTCDWGSSVNDGEPETLCLALDAITC